MSTSSETPESMARQTGYPREEWVEAQEVLGEWWDVACETVAHLTVLTSWPPARVARILVGGTGFPGVLGKFPDDPKVQPPRRLCETSPDPGWFFLPSVADPSAPTVAELEEGVELPLTPPVLSQEYRYDPATEQPTEWEAQWQQVRDRLARGERIPVYRDGELFAHLAPSPEPEADFTLIPLEEPE